MSTSSTIISQYPVHCSGDKYRLIHGVAVGVGVPVAVLVAVAVKVTVGEAVGVAEESVGETVGVNVAVGGCELCRVMRGDIQSAKSSCELPFVKTVRMNFTLWPLNALRSILTV